jgi:hypothetical protein
MSLRELFVHIRRLADHRRHPERLERLLDLAARAQNRDPTSPGYGNFKWLWRDAGVTDPNAVEFAVQNAAATWRQHHEWLPPPARAKLRELLTYAVEGCLRHRVPVTYTNIAILNAGNVAVLGEILDRPDVAEEGYRRLEALCLWTWAFGISEFCSPTYYGVDLDGLEFFLSFSRNERGRQQAAALRELLWTDTAMNWFPAAGKLAGSHSRSYDFLRGIGSLDGQLKAAGWLAADVAGPGQWSGDFPDALARLREAARSQFSRLVRERWGMRLNQSRTHALYPDVTLSCSASAYFYQDVPLTVDLPGNRNLPRCYFIADGREDPYGKLRVEAGPSRHLKAVHLVPFWAAAQRNRDALGLVMYRPSDLNKTGTVPLPPLKGTVPVLLSGGPLANLQSHMVLRRPTEGLWLAGQPADVPRGTEDMPGRVPVGLNSPIVLRYGSAAVGMRLVWSRAQDGKPAAAALVDDGNRFGVIRLTVEHRREGASAEAGAGLWVRVGSGLADATAFDQWRKRFEASMPTAVEASAGQVRIEVPGEEGAVSVAARAPFGQGGGVLYQPEPTRAVLEVNGKEIGRTILERVEPIRTLCRACARRGSPDAAETAVVPIRVPAGGVFWEAESGFILHGMTIGEDPRASQGRYVVQPEARQVYRLPGSVTWLLEAARPGRYHLWARTIAPNEQANSFYVQMMSDTDELPGHDAWHLRTSGQWSWQRLTLGKNPTPTPVDLPAGRAWLQLRTREPGTKIDRLMLTPDADAQPE